MNNNFNNNFFQMMNMNWGFPGFPNNTQGGNINQNMLPNWMQMQFPQWQNTNVTPNVRSVSAQVVKQASQPKQTNNSQQSPARQMQPVQPAKSVQSVQPVQPVKPTADTEKKKRTVEIENKYTVKNISDDDLYEIFTQYGNNIEDIYELSPGQKWMFENGHEVHNTQMLQLVIEAELKLDPVAFRHQYDSVCNRLENLRNAICYTNLSKPYRVLLKNREQQMYFGVIDSISADATDEEKKKLIDKFLAADRERGFDIEGEPLIRVKVLRIHDTDKYIFIISQPHINSDGTSVGVLMNDLFIDYALKFEGIDIPVCDNSYTKYAEFLEKVDIKKEMDYWKSLYSDMPELKQLPGRRVSSRIYHLGSYKAELKKSSIDGLKKLQSSTKATFFNILQTAWAISLNKLQKSDEVCFGTITSGRDTSVQGSMMLSGEFANVVPMRVKLDDDETFKESVSKLQALFNENNKHAYCTPKEICSSLNRSTPLFDHLINYHNFAIAPEDNMTKGCFGNFNIIGGQVYVSPTEDLNVVFRTEGGQMMCYMDYNQNVYPEKAVVEYVKYFNRVIETIAKKGVDIKISEIPRPDDSVFEKIAGMYVMNNIQIAEFLKETDIFSNFDYKELLDLASKFRVDYYHDSQVIVEEHSQNDRFMFVLDGMVVTTKCKNNAWDNVVEVVKNGKILINGLDKDGASEFGFVSMSDNTKILSISYDEMIEIMSTYKEVSIAATKEVLDKYVKYVKLWLNAE